MDRAVDPEAVDYDAMSRRLFRVVAIGAHARGRAGAVDPTLTTLALGRQRRG
jgi:hypothetical protein